MEKIHTIYILKNTVNSLVYIGRTSRTLKSRFTNHKSTARRNPEHLHICKIMSEIGVDKFYIEQLDLAYSEKESRELEKHYILKYKSNQSEFGYNINAGDTISESSKQKMSEVWDDERKSKLIERNKSSDFWTDEIKDKLSKSCKEFWTPEKRAKQSERSKARVRKPWTDDMKAKQSKLMRDKNLAKQKDQA